jgi:hypothetical protein
VAYRKSTGPSLRDLAVQTSGEQRILPAKHGFDLEPVGSLPVQPVSFSFPGNIRHAGDSRVNRIKHLLKRYWPLLLWIAFAPITAEAARNPGFVPNPESVPYSWGAALLTWARLGIEAGIFTLVLRSGRRLPLAFALAAVLFFLSMVFYVTDMPGYSYVPGRFHLALVTILGVLWMVDASGRRTET